MRIKILHSAPCRILNEIANGAIIVKHNGNSQKGLQENMLFYTWLTWKYQKFTPFLGEWTDLQSTDNWLGVLYV